MYHATRTSFAPRSEPTDPPHSNSSVFTFLIALLILLCTSAAVVLRAALMRRRLRRRMQDGLGAGVLLPTQPAPEEKPELWDLTIRGADSTTQDWSALAPLCATQVPDGGAEPPPPPRLIYNPPPAGRLMDMLGHPPTLPTVTVQQQPAKPPAAAPPACSTVQVAVLISMPAQPPARTPAPASPPSSLKGKEKDPDAPADTDAGDPYVFPDVVFGISTFALPPPDAPAA